MFYRLMKMIVAPMLRIFFRPWTEGMENIPDEGGDHREQPPVVLGLLLPACTDEASSYLHRQGRVLQHAGPQGRLTAAFFKGVGQLPVDRSGVRGAGEAAIRSAIAVIDSGELFGVYPEGTRSPDGKLYRGKVGGLARVALQTGAPVIPVAMIDTEKVQPPGQVIPNFGVRPGIRIGRPMDFSRYQGMENDRFILRSVTDEVMYEIMRLSGQEYVDIYATAAKRQIADEKKRAEAERRAEQRAERAAEKERQAAEKAAQAEAEKAQDSEQDGKG